MDVRQLTAIVDKAIRRSQLGTIQFDDTPTELCTGEDVNLSRWTMTLKDKNLVELAKQMKPGSQYYHIDASKPNCKEMFHEFFQQRLSTGIQKLNISGAKDITNYGISVIARSSPHLREIVISGCTSIEDSGLRELGMHCLSLRVLLMSGCHGIEGGGFSSIAERCLHLSTIDISHCKKLQRWGIYKLFETCRSLENVNVSQLMCVGDEEIRVLAQSNNHITSLSAADAFNISDAAILALSQNCSDLDTLDLSRKQMLAKITDVSLLALGERCPSLRVLKLVGCDYVSDVGLNWLSIGCHALEHLDLEDCTKITDAGLRSVGTNCNSLQYINLTNAKYVSDVGIASIATGCRMVKSLTCNGLYLLADPRLLPSKKKKGEKMDDDPWQAVIGVTALSKYCNNIEDLDLTGCFRLNLTFQKHLSKGMKTLRKLNITGCNQVESSSLIAVGEGCTLLTEINFTDCGNNINTLVLEAFATHCTQLKVIEVSRCENIRGGSMKAISKCNQLEKINISGCKALTDTAILPICEVDKVKSLHTIYMNDIPNLTDTALAWISNGCSQLKTISFKGTSITKTATKACRDNYPYSDMIYNNNFMGFWPKSRLKDRIVMNEYFALQQGIIKIQARCRKLIGIRRVELLKKNLELFWSAMRVIKCVRQVIAKKKVKLLREKERRRKIFGFRILATFRIYHARCRLRVIRRHRLLYFQSRKATIIQTAYRNYRSRLAVRTMQKAFLNMVRYRRQAAIVLQNAARMFRCKRQLAMMREWVLTQTRVRRKKVIIIQKSYRGYVARRLVWYLKEHLAAIQAQKEDAAKIIQQKFRAIRTAYFVQLSTQYAAKRFNGAQKIQAVVRGKIARLHYTMMLVRIQEDKESLASCKIQNRWRVKAAIIKVNELRRKRALELARKADASTTFSKHWRARDARLQLKELKYQRDEAIRLRVQTEFWAAIKIQSVYRGMKGRLYFDEKLREKKGKWKELMDDETGRRFFYNKLTGEIRWRMPQDLLDLIPRPKCDNCLSFEASVECGVCNEFFCNKCWDVIHYGGRRKDHEFRALYDFYNKRIDYGDGNFPCKWPSEVMQDDVQGWMLRVAPIRPPIARYGDWEHYYSESEYDADGNVKREAINFFFNRKTFEANYYVPDELLDPSQMSSPLDASARMLSVSASFNDSGYFNTTALMAQQSQSLQQSMGQQSYYGSSYLDTSTYQMDKSFSESNYGYYDRNGSWVAYK